MTTRDRNPGSGGAAGADPPLRIQPMVRGMLPAVADLHHRSFGTRLGRRYSRALVAWFMNRDDAIAIAAVDGAGAPIGYAVGAPAGHEAALERALRPTVAAQLAVRPWRWFDPYIVRTVVARLRPARGSAQGPGPSRPVETPGATRAAGPSMCLVAIGVSPAARGRGVGVLLMEAFETRARALGARSMTLWVRRDNDAARRLYERCGWSAGAAGDYRKTL